MPSFSELEGPRVRLVLQAQTPMTEVSVMDAQNQQITLEHNAGSLELDVPPGVYKVAFQEGDAVDTHLTAVMPGREEVVVRQQPLAAFTSSQPLDHEGELADPADAEAVNHLISGMDVTSPAGLVVFVRDLGNEHERARLAPAPDTSQSVPNRSARVDLVDAHVGRHLTVRNADGGLLSEMVYDDPGRLTGGLGAGVDPGRYRIRVDTGVGAVLELPIVVIPHMQTEVYLLCRQYGKNSLNRRPDLQSATICLRRLGTYYDSTDASRHLAELGLSTLRTGRALEGNQLNQILRGKFEDPMLGIYGAHLVLRGSKPDRELLNVIVVNTANALEGNLHPDLAAVALAAGLAPSSAARFQWPPSLRASWNLVVETSLTTPQLVPSGSMSDRISARTASGGPWLTWNGPPELDDPEMDKDHAEVPSSAGAIADLTLDEVARVIDRAPHQMQPGELAVTQEVAKAFAQQPERRRRAELIEDAIDLDEVSANLSLPPTSVKRIADNVQRRMGGLHWS